VPVDGATVEAGDDPVLAGLTVATELDAFRDALHRPMPTPVTRKRTAAAAAPSQIFEPILRADDSRIGDPPP
jgi:hypothetical protein